MTADAEAGRWLALALALCDEADPIALAAFRGARDVTSKADGTLVTSADRAIETVLRERIGSLHPEHGIVGEEHGTEGGERAIRWFVDPIDGTSNFVRGVPVFATLVAVERDGVLAAAAVSAPALGTRWWASRGGGAWAAEDEGEPRRLAVSAVELVAESHLLYGSPTSLRGSGAMPGLDDLLARCWRDRGFGDFWGHMLVAEGAAEAMLEVGLAPWDIAAPMLVVEEAGGRVTDVHGGSPFGSLTCISSNAAIHATLLDALRSPGPSEG